jgi:hypothetical protein
VKEQRLKESRKGNKCLNKQKPNKKEWENKEGDQHGRKI